MRVFVSSARILQIFTLLWIATTLPGHAQQYQGLRLNVSVEKEFKLNKKTRLQLEQQLQMTPEIKRNRTRDLDFGEIDFIGDTFLPRGNGYDGRDDDDDDDDDGIPDTDDNDDDNDGTPDSNDDDDPDGDDDDDDNSDTPPGSGTPVGGQGTGAEEVPFNRFDYRMGLRSASTVAVQWEFYKNFRLASGYVFLIRPGENTHRLFLDVVYSQRFMDKKLGFNGRVRLLNEGGRNKKDKFVVETFAVIGSQLRWRNSSKTAKSRISPFLSGDLIYDFDGRKFNRLRYTLGVDYDLTKNQQLSFSLISQRRINVSRPDASFVVALGYTLQL
jgi:hypothetical protein